MHDLSHIESYLRQQLPDDKKQASWGYLAQQFPWYPVLHWLRAAHHPDDVTLKQMAVLYARDPIWLHLTLKGQSGIPETAGIPEATSDAAQPVAATVTDEPATAVTEPEVIVSTEEPVDEVHQETNVVINEADTPAEEQQISISLPNLNEPARGDLAFEPFHTVDYFASQGIKVAKGPETPLDRQVKSFTEWLKSMKKLSYQPPVSYTDPLVERQARSSLAGGEVVTEAMADVWAKQGQLDKAEMVFTKLMLQYPEKSHYFAARLKDLKEKS